MPTVLQNQKMPITPKHILTMPHSKHILVLLLAVLGIAGVRAQNYSPVAAIHCETPGTLQLTHAAKMATTLKVTGNINACDFQTLKAATMNVTRELDLSEATIHPYAGWYGCYEEITSDWFIKDPESVTYPANTLPIDAFAEVRDNSLSKWREGSSSLRKIVLPKTLEGVMPRSFDMAQNLETIEVAPGNAALYTDGHALYDSKCSTLLGIVPAFYGDLELPASVTAIADAVFDRAHPASVTFRSANLPAMNEETAKKLKCAYIVAPNPEAYKERFPDIDCTTAFDYITVSDVAPGDLANRLVDMGCKRADLRALRVSGGISEDELKWLMALPNLHKLDLSGTVMEYMNDARIYGAALTDLSLPSATNSGSLYLQSPYLKGELTITEGIYWLNCTAGRFDKVVFPASLGDFCEDAFNKLPIREADFGRCVNLKRIDGFYNCTLLRKMTLPPSVERIENIYAPIAEMELPASLKSIRYSGNWEVEELTLPASLEEISLGKLPELKRIDASQAVSLELVSGFSHCPLLEEADFSQSPLTTFQAFGGDRHLNPAYIAQGAAANAPARVVSSGGTHYPAPSLCAIASVKLPSSLKNLSGLAFCDNLRTLDLGGMYQLESIDVASDCPVLQSVSLPYSAKSINGFKNCPALTQVRLAASQAPTVGAEAFDGDLSQVALTVPDGCRGTYLMADKWEQCKSITEGGYVVRFQKGINDYTELVHGLGLYAPGTTVTLKASPIKGIGPDLGKTYVPLGWQISEMGQIDAETAVFEMPIRDVTCTPYYSVLLGEPTMEFEINAFEDGNLRVANPWASFFPTDYSIYLDDERQTVSEDGNLWPLGAGKHHIRVFGTLRSLSIGVNSDYRPQEFVEITDVNIGEDAHTYLSLGKVNLSTIDFSGWCQLDYLDINGGRIETLDVSGITINSLCVDGCGLRSVKLGQQPGLWQLKLWGNELTSIDLSGCTGLESFDMDNNTLYVDVDAQGYFDLSTLEATGFDISRMGNPSYPVEGTRMLISPDHQFAQAYYDYDAGNGTQVRFCLCFDPSVSGIAAPEASTGTIVLAGHSLIVSDFGEPLRVYSPSGALVAVVPPHARTAVHLPVAGVYVLRSGGYTRKLAVR